MCSDGRRLGGGMVIVMIESSWPRCVVSCCTTTRCLVRAIWINIIEKLGRNPTHLRVGGCGGGTNEYGSLDEQQQLGHQEDCHPRQVHSQLNRTGVEVSCKRQRPKHFRPLTLSPCASQKRPFTGLYQI